MASHTPDSQQSRSRIRKTVWGFVAALVVILLVGGAVLVWSIQRPFPDTAGTWDIAGLQHEVTVQRDPRGIPVITAETSHDLFLAQGYVHAQDRFWEMDFRRHMTGGRLAELFGESQLGADKFLRSLDWHGIAEREVAQLPDRERAYYEAYADGVNAYLAQRQGGALAFEYTVLGLQNPGYEPEPWTPVDSVAWLKAMAWDLRTNLEDETTRALLTQHLNEGQLAELYPGYPFDKHPVVMAEDPDGSGILDANIPERSGDLAQASQPQVTVQHKDTARSADHLQLEGLVDVIAKVDALMPAVGEGIGSNAWVVSGEHTATGEPILANDPHLGATLPSVWYQNHVRCAPVTEDCPYDAAGYSFSGLPGIVIGHNQDVAWGFTNLTTDVADLYIERVEDDGYWHDGEKLPFDTRQEVFEIAGRENAELEVRSTHHGPILSDLEPDFGAIASDPPGESDEISDDVPPGEWAVSLRWTALDVTTTAQSIFTLNRVTDFADFRQAAYEFEVPGQNLMYADVEGNIGYQAPGKLPIRGAGDGYLPQPGWDSAYDWQGFIPHEELPVVYNPESGYIVTANHAIVQDDYPYMLSRDWDYGHRAARIVTRLEAMIDEGPLTVEAMAELHMDNHFPAAEPLQQAYAQLEVQDAEVQAALELLAAWDGHNETDSAGAAYANVVWNHVTEAMMNTHAGAIRRDNQSRFVEFFVNQLDDPASAWWGGDQRALLQTAAVDAYAELTELQGTSQAGWNWGELHALPLTHETFGTSGIAPLEALFNRGPYPTGGGSGVVNATGWELDASYATESVPSMRMVLDLDEWDNSVWQNLTGTSGHTFHLNYVDQTDDWAQGAQFSWRYSAETIEEAAVDTLVLQPGDST